MSLGARVIERLRSAPDPVVEVDDGVVRVRVDVAGAGPYGADLRRLEVTPLSPGGPVDVVRRAERIEGAVLGLPEPLVRHEVDGRLGRAVLRTRPDALRDGEYDECWVEGDGRVDLGRYRGATSDAPRQPRSMNLGLRAVERLIDTIGEVVRGGDERG